MNNEPTELLLPDTNLHLLVELIESMDESIKQLNSVISQQQLLLDVVNNSEHHDEFSEFANGVATSITNMLDEHKILSNRVALLKTVVKKAKESDENLALISNLLSGLGVFNK